MKELLKHSALCWITFIIILIHITYMCYARQEFAVGGEWFVYALAIAYVIYEVTENDRN